MTRLVSFRRDWEPYRWEALRSFWSLQGTICLLAFSSIASLPAVLGLWPPPSVFKVSDHTTSAPDPDPPPLPHEDLCDDIGPT